VARCLAVLHEKTMAEMGRITTSNFTELFQLNIVAL
jgi:hypothetical protein